MKHVKHAGVWCVLAALALSHAAPAATFFAPKRPPVSSRDRARYKPQHSVVTIGNGRSTGQRTSSSTNRVQTVTARSTRLTPERPMNREQWRIAEQNRQLGYRQASIRDRQVDTANRKSIPRRAAVTAASKTQTPPQNEVWTTQGDGSGR
ncbi:MAG: hypothetical protein U0637_15845 [Phycisphaerales bacterium]